MEMHKNTTKIIAIVLILINFLVIFGFVNNPFEEIEEKRNFQRNERMEKGTLTENDLKLIEVEKSWDRIFGKQSEGGNGK